LSDLLISQANFANFFANYSRTSSRTVRFGSKMFKFEFGSVRRFSKMHTSSFKVLFLPILVWKARFFGPSWFGTRGEPESIPWRFARVFSLSRQNRQKNRIIRN
jgi:hypothetical protein